MPEDTATQNKTKKFTNTGKNNKNCRKLEEIYNLQKLLKITI